MLDEFDNELCRKNNSVSRFIFMLLNPNTEWLRNEVLCNLASCWTDENQYISSYSKIDVAVEENAREQYSCITEEERELMHFYIQTSFIARNTLLQGSVWYHYDHEENLEDSER